MRLWQLVFATWVGLNVVVVVLWQGFWQHVRAAAARQPRGMLFVDAELVAPSEVRLDRPVAGEPAERRTR